MCTTDRVVVITCMLCFLISAGASFAEVSNCTDCIIINEVVTLSYVLSNTSLTNKEVVLQGDHWINHTLTVSNVDDLTIRSKYNTKSTIYCRQPLSTNDMGAGLVFVSVSNLSISNITFNSCGTLQFSTTIRNGINVKYRSAVYIINSTNINFTNTDYQRSVGRGLSLHDVGGFVEIKNCVFLENRVLGREVTFLFGGGGLYIEFTYCAPGHTTCNQTENNYNKRNRYEIKDCVFGGNRATNNEMMAQGHIIQFRKQTARDGPGVNAGQGGGIHITMKDSSLQNTITIHNCSFYNNSAEYGGGLDVTLQDNSWENTINVSACSFYNNSARYGGGVDVVLLDDSQENAIHISACRFTKNYALERSGGALSLGYNSGENGVNNAIHVQDTQFVDNSAGRGGAVSFFSSRIKTNRLEFLDCMWIGNSASIGAAMSLRPIAESSIFSGATPTPFLCRCLFIDNHIIDTAAFLKSASDATTKHELESGVLHLESIEVKFNDSVSFRGSRGSAIHAISSQINVLENSGAHFVNNTASYGGAMALLSHSILKLYPDSRIDFNSNRATELGGAVYATSPHQTEFIYSHKCFISHVSGSHPDNWTTLLIFENNTAKYGHAIYADSLLPCAKSVFDMTDVDSALKWTPFVYTEVGKYTIATSPATINFSLPDVNCSWRENRYSIKLHR